MKNNHFFVAACTAIVLGLGLVACNKSGSNSDTSVPPGKENVSLYLTDGPGLFDQVLIDIKSVKVLVDTTSRRHDEDWDHKGEDEDNGRGKKDSVFVWETLSIAPGIYDILKFRNGVDTLLANSNIVKGSIRVIKIELGTNNTLVKDGVTYPLYLPANAHNYVLVKLNGEEFEHFLPGKKRLWLDFDVQRSIVQEGNNRFYLKPVFHAFIVSNTGSIAGKVAPKESNAVITVFNSRDTAYALPDREGNFKVRGIVDGKYSVFINASNGYMDSTITNVSVNAPRETSLGTITLHK